MSEQYTSVIKNKSETNNNPNYRLTKIRRENSTVNQIESIKKDIDLIKEYIKSIKR